jgi:iron complex transport system ATP-binding protein
MIDPATEPSGIRLHEVTYTPNNTLILKDVSLDVTPGQCIGILGPNGAGKSTLLRIIAAVLSASTGTVLLDGLLVGHWPARERARRLAFVPQRTSQTLPFRVRELVLMGRAPYLHRWQQEGEVDWQVVDQALRLTDAMHLAERDVTTLSGGEMQRVTLARALAQQPRFLLLDEPTASLDLRHQAELFDVVTTLTQQGVTVLAALHDINLAATYCSTVILLSEGSVTAAGRPAEVLTPQTLRSVFAVEVFLSTNPVTGAPYIVPLPIRTRGTP